MSYIEVSINGTLSAQFTEEGSVPIIGQICLQAHAGGPFEVRYKDLVLQAL